MTDGEVSSGGVPLGNLHVRLLEPSGDIPNSPLPLVYWRGRLPVAAREGAKAQALFRRNGWQGTWVYTVFPFWHFHTLGHEALACVSGTAQIGFGGDGQLVANVEPGDVCIIPAGVGHKKIGASGDFLMAGCYPPRHEGNIVRPGDYAPDRIAREIETLTLPATDPISGGADGIVPIWRSIQL